MSRVDSFDDANLRAICGVLADTSEGLTGGEISRLLGDCEIADPLGASATKAHRLFEALAARQRRDGCGNNVTRFIVEAMRPVRYVKHPTLFDERRAHLNEVLSFVGLSLSVRGELERVAAARTIPEARARAGRLRSALVSRQVHPDVLHFCKAELLQDDYFHAVLEATKSVADKVRRKSGLTSDGAELVDGAFGLGRGHPRVAFNSLQTETERKEHAGLMNSMKGLFGAFRNPTAHERGSTGGSMSRTRSTC